MVIFNVNNKNSAVFRSWTSVLYSDICAVQILRLAFFSPKYVIIICCCKLNNTLDSDEYLFGQVSTCTGPYQLPIFPCTNVHL